MGRKKKPKQPPPPKKLVLHRPTKEELKEIDKRMADRRAWLAEMERIWGKD